jgi:hypothetical protein
MLSPSFNYAIFRLQRPDWVSNDAFDDAVNLLRAATALRDLVRMGGSVRRDPQNGALLLWVATTSNGECWLRFRWNEPHAYDLTVVVL